MLEDEFRKTDVLSKKLEGKIGIKHDLQALQREEARLREELVVRTKEVDELTARIAAITEESRSKISSLQQELEVATAASRNDRTSLSEATSRVHNLTEDLSRAQAENAAHVEKATSSKGQIQRLKEDIVHKEKTISKLEKKSEDLIRAKEEARNEAEHKMDLFKEKTERERDELKSALERLRGECNQVKHSEMTQVSDLQQKLLYTEKERTLLANQLEAANRELEVLRANAYEKRDMLKNWHAEAMQVNQAAFSHSDSLMRQTVGQWQEQLTKLEHHWQGKLGEVKSLSPVLFAILLLAGQRFSSSILILFDHTR